MILTSYLYFLMLMICFAKIDFSDQCRMAGEDRDVRCDENFISSKTYLSDNMFIEDLLRRHVRKQPYYVNITLIFI
jgi:hypothetical protein